MVGAAARRRRHADVRRRHQRPGGRADRAAGRQPGGAGPRRPREQGLPRGDRPGGARDPPRRRPAARRGRSSRRRRSGWPSWSSSPPRPGRAFAKGDTAAASIALGRVLAIDPRHPVATELSAALNQHFRRQAEDARRGAEQARAAAASAPGAPGPGRLRAGGAPARRGGDAVRQRRVRRGHPASCSVPRRVRARAARRGSGARAQARRSPRPGPGRAAGGAQQRGDAAAALRAAGAPARHRAARHGRGQRPPPTAPAGQSAGGAEEPAIRRVLADYGRAIEGKDLALFRSVKPNLSGDEEKRLRRRLQGREVPAGRDHHRVGPGGGRRRPRCGSRGRTRSTASAMRAVKQTFRLVQAGPELDDPGHRPVTTRASAGDTAGGNVENDRAECARRTEGPAGRRGGKG